MRSRAALDWSNKEHNHRVRDCPYDMRLQRNAANAVAPRVAIIDAEGDYGHVHVRTDRHAEMTLVQNLMEAQSPIFT